MSPSLLSKLRLVTVDVTGTLIAYKGQLGDYYCMAAKSAGMPCPDYERVHQGFKLAYAEMSRRHPCFGHAAAMPNAEWWKVCVRDSFAMVRSSIREVKAMEFLRAGSLILWGTWCVINAGRLRLRRRHVREDIPAHLRHVRLLRALHGVPGRAPLPEVAAGQGARRRRRQQRRVPVQGRRLAGAGAEPGQPAMPCSPSLPFRRVLEL
jgi:hypothetical protein